MKKPLLLLLLLNFSLSAWASGPHNHYFDEGYLKFGHRDYQGAIPDLDKSIEQDPDDAVAIIMRAGCKGEVGDWNGAVADAERAVGLAEKSGDVALPRYKDMLSTIKNGKARHDAEAAPSYVSQVGVQRQSVSPAVQPGRSDNGAAVNPAEILAAHNRWRAEVGVPDIAYSDTLAVSAQAWADNLRDTHQCHLQHSTGNYGENLFWAGAWSNGPMQDISSTRVVDSWSSEKSNYNYADNRCAEGKVCGHYTQVVWKNTTSVGCAVAVCQDNSQVWACQYKPAGNYVGQKPY